MAAVAAAVVVGCAAAVDVVVDALQVVDEWTKRRTSSRLSLECTVQGRIEGAEKERIKKESFSLLKRELRHLLQKIIQNNSQTLAILRFKLGKNLKRKLLVTLPQNYCNFKGLSF